MSDIGIPFHVNISFLDSCFMPSPRRPQTNEISVPTFKDGKFELKFTSEGDGHDLYHLRLENDLQVSIDVKFPYRIDCGSAFSILRVPSVQCDALTEKPNEVYKTTASFSRNKQAVGIIPVAIKVHKQGHTISLSEIVFIIEPQDYVTILNQILLEYKIRGHEQVAITELSSILRNAQKLIA
jgi:hypothetical protein